jgi:hypothetical protein
VPQTATAQNTVNAVVEVSTDGTTWTNISGSTNKVDVAPQTVDSGEAATFEGDFMIVTSGKKHPVEATVTILYTETSGEAAAILEGQRSVAGNPLYFRYTPGGYNGTYRYKAATSTGNTAAARITEFPTVSVDAAAGGPQLMTFKIRATQFVREAATPSPSASVSPSASISA